MEDVIIPPAGASTTGFLASQGHRGRDQGCHTTHVTKDWLSTGDFLHSQERILASVGQNAVTMSEGFADIRKEACDGFGHVNEELAEGFGADRLETVRQGQALQTTVEKTAAAVNLAVEKTAAAGILEASKNSAAALLDSSKNAAAAALAAATNTASILAKQEDCCCELKELIREDGQKTRDLINSIQSTNLAVQLSDAKAEILALKIKAGGI